MQLVCVGGLEPTSRLSKPAVARRDERCRPSFPAGMGGRSYNGLPAGPRTGELWRNRMILEVRAVAPFYKNGFVAGCERTREAVVIDPGDETDQLIGAVRDLDVDVRLVLLTHAHVDHITGVAAIKDAYSAPVYLHQDDVFLYEAAT